MRVKFVSIFALLNNSSKMKIRSFTLAISSIILFSCNYDNQKMLNHSFSILNEKREEIKERTVTYDLQEISSEGAEAIVTYSNNQIKTCKINVYGETGQTEIIYEFEADHIFVIKKRQTYTTDLEHTTAQNSIIQKDIHYSINYSGKYMENRNDANKFDEIYLEMKKVVPFKIL